MDRYYSNNANQENKPTSLHRETTAMGTVGAMGQLFTVYEKNWFCPDCKQENYASVKKCFRCKKSKPETDRNFVMDPALVAMQNGETEACPWKEAIDPNSYQMYYYNTVTGATQWERPEAMGAAPIATGWFGRGKAGSTAALVYSDLNDKYLSRPAKKQKDFIDPTKYHVEGAQEYNIWYGKHMGSYDDKLAKEPATDRCVLVTDAGYTKADAINLSSNSNAVRKDRRSFCLHFAHGMCAKGADCSFYHRIPLPKDDANTDELYDCFGRQKHNKHKDDMSGVGSFMKPCRTLFVGGLLKHKYHTPKDLEDAVWKHFSEWGELENVNVIHRLAIAFPRYRLRTSAEFAKEAMDRQSLDQEELLAVKWAHDDPNPVAKEAIEKANKDALAALLLARGINLDTDTGFDYPSQYEVPSANCALTSTEESENQADGGESSRKQSEATGESDEPEGHAYYIKYYGDAGEEALDDDYDGTEAAGSRKRLRVENVGNAAGVDISSNVKLYPNTDAQYATNEPVADVSSTTSASNAAGEWLAATDPTSGATYYYHSVTGETSWGVGEDEPDSTTAEPTSTTSTDVAKDKNE